MEALTLSGTGLAVAIAMGLLFAVFGGPIWWFFLFGMLLFLVLSAIVTWVGTDYKKKKMLGQDPRGVRNVMANGLVPLIMAGLYRLSLIMGAERYAAICLVCFIASVAAITADKFASEIGVLGPMPISLITGKRVRKGVSGGITWLGLAVSVIAPIVIAVALLLISISFLHVGLSLAVVIVVLAGFIGSLVDSVLGHYEERGIGNKFTSNFMCSVAGALVAFLLVLAL